MVVMVSRCAVLLFATGCTLAKTHEQPDAPSISCTSPAFTSGSTQANMSVTDFNIDQAGDLAIAMCNGSICQGSATSLAMSQLASPTGTSYANPRLTPGGNELFVRTTTPLDSHLESYARASGNGWDVEGTVAFSTAMKIGSSTTFSQPTTGERGRHMIVADGTNMIELSQSAPNALPSDPWSPVTGGMYTPATFGVASMTEPNLSADGTILVFRGADGIYYVTRSDLEQPFAGSAKMLWSQAGATATTPYLAPDCTRLFFSIDGDLDYAVP